MKVALGTVQFGLDYGISNRAGQVPADEARRILTLAARSGVRLLDTAAAYGEAERRLGELLDPGHRFSIVTKLPRLPDALAPGDVPRWAEERLAESLRRLRTQRVYGLLAHNAADLLGPRGAALWAALAAAGIAGSAEKVGASVYTAEEIDALMARHPLRLVQLPLSVLDQRLARSGHLAGLRKSGVEVHARSALLQGLLLMDPSAPPSPYFDAVRAPLRAFHDAARAAGVTPLEAAVGYVLGQPDVDRAVFGVTREAELAGILAAAGAPARMDCTRFAIDDRTILNPALWPALR